MNKTIYNRLLKGLILWLCMTLSSHVFALQLREIKYDRNTNVFYLLYNANNYSCDGYAADISSLNILKFADSLKSPGSLYGYQYFAYLLNAPDNNFINDQNLNNPDTLSCEPDSLYCTVSRRFDLHLKDYISDYKNKKLYALIQHTKSADDHLYLERQKGNYILKFPADSVTTYATTSPALETFYKIPSPDTSYRMFQQEENSIILISHYFNPNINNPLRDTNFRYTITELDSGLHVLRRQEFVHHLKDSLYNSIYNCDFKYRKINGHHFITFINNDYITSDSTIIHYIIWEYDPDFNLLDSNFFYSAYEAENYFRNKNGQHIFYYRSGNSTLIKMTNTEGDTIHNLSLPTQNKLVETKDSSFVMMQMEDLHEPDGYGNPQYGVFVYKWNKNGKLKKRSLYDLEGGAFYVRIPNTPDYNSYGLMYEVDTLDNVTWGYSYTEGGGCTHYDYLVIDAFNLNFINVVSGYAISDTNNNCIKDSAEQTEQNILVEMQLNGKSYFTTTDYTGKFHFILSDTGHARVIVHLQNQRYFNDACTDTFNVLIADTSTNPAVDFMLHTTHCAIPLPKLNVQISTPFLRRCFNNSYTLTVTNEGTDTAYNAFVDVDLDNSLIPVDTQFLSAQNLGNNTYRFSLHTVAPQQIIRKKLIIKVDCDSTIPGQTHCVKATSSPYAVCGLDFTYYAAFAKCKNDSVVFIISDISMPQIANPGYRIIVDDSIQYTGTLHFDFGHSTEYLSFYNPLGKTYRLETTQRPMYEGEDTVLSAAIEGCGNPEFSTGFITLFPPDDDAPNVDIDCHQNRGSMDPNEKIAQPDGFGSEQSIMPNTPVEYTIFFQNTGTYAASNVKITDTLDSALDITSIKFLNSSHDFSYSIIDSNIIEFHSTNIYLTAEADDTTGSQGFVKFSISPKSTAATGTAIHNKASIVFDFNDPIETNTVVRTLNDFVTIRLITSISHYSTAIKSTIYPNPFRDYTNLSFDYTHPTTLSVFSIDGKIIRKYSSTSGFYRIEGQDLSRGVYLYELQDKQTNQLLDSGKLIVD